MKRALVCVFLVACAACGGNEPAAQQQTGGVRERDVTFKTSDDFTLTGRLFGRGKIGVTLAHMYPSDARSWYPAAQRIARAGYMALAFNFRGYLGSQGPKQIAKAPADLAAAAAYLKTVGARDVAFAGASMGGTASIIEGQAENPLAVIAVSAPTNFMGLDATLAANGVQRPVLLIASRGDSAAFDSLQKFLRSLPNPDSLVYDGTAHGTALLESRPEAVGRMIRFLKRYAPLPTPTAKP